MNLQQMIEGNPQALVTTRAGVTVADSLQVADSFGKRHTHVLRAIDDLVAELSKEDDFSQPNFGSATNYFIPDTYPDKQGKERRRYWLTRDGFSLLVMGFTGPAALHWKLLYIDAFNKMEAAVNTKVDVRRLVTEITTDVLRTLLPEVRQAVEPAPQQPVQIEDTRVHNSRRLDFLYGNTEALPNFLTVYDVRDYLGIGQRQAYELVRSEGFPKKTVGNTYRIPKADFLKWMDDNK